MSDQDIQERRRADGFRERGQQVTRLETFVDAAFAFALTLIVISVGDVPQDVQGLVQALKFVPAFACSFAMIAMFWLAHDTWSRCYGLDDARSLRLSLALVFVVLIFIYPLRMMFGSMFGFVTQHILRLQDPWRLPFSFHASSYDDIRVMFAVYAVCWSSLGLIFVGLYRQAWRQRDALGLDTAERVATLASIARWWMLPATGAISLLLTLLVREDSATPAWVYGLPGMAYFLMFLTRPVLAITRRRARDRLSLP